MKLIFIVVLALVSGLGSPLLSQKSARPKLAVGIVVDQMRHDYLYRYWDKYSEGGFKKLMNEGFSCENAHYNYVPTVTGPGHASVFTGTTPAVHGIIGNDWPVRNSRKSMYCAGDESVKSVGGNILAGRMSPKNMLANTVTDELRLYYYDRAKVIGIAIKDRGAILPAGHHPNGAYWFDSQSGNFMTSSFYMDALPAWVDRFNKMEWCKTFNKQGWNTLLPIEQYVESEADLNQYEGKITGETSPVFPRVFNQDKKEYGHLLYTPAGNTLITEFVKSAILAEELGKDPITDMITISYSSPDYAGHLFGLQSVEIQDMYMRLDLELQALLQFLDQEVGVNEYVVFLTADHAVAHNPQYLKDRNYPADYFEFRKLADSLKKVLELKYGPYIVDNYGNLQIYLNEERIVSKKLNRQAIVSDAKAFIRNWAGVVDVIDREEIPFLNSTHPYYKLIQLGYYPQRSGDLFLLVQPGWFDSISRTGTTHGSPYQYDTHIPMVWYGWNIPAGKSYEAYDIIDVAPTLSYLLKIPQPSASIGKPIHEILAKK
jgi:arylsulfatase A-like enzyme